MALNLPNFRQLGAADMGGFDLGKAIQQGLNNKYASFKASPSYQEAMLSFLKNQGSHLQAQTQNLPAERELKQAQANEINQRGGLENQKLSLLNNWIKGIEPPNKNASYNQPGTSTDVGNIYNASYQPDGSVNGFTNVSRPYIPSEDHEAGNRAFQKERAMASILGFKEPATFVDPKTGMAYARLREGTVPIGKEFSESEKTAASEVGKAKGQEEANYIAEAPEDRRLLSDLMGGVEKINKGDWDPALGWRHRIPFGLNSKMSDQAIGDLAAFEKSLNNLKIKQQSLLSKGQGHITDFSRALLNSTFPDINANPAAFKGQINQFLNELKQKTFESKQIRKYEKEGLSFDEARERAQADSDEMFSLNNEQNKEPSNQEGFKTALYEPEAKNMQSSEYNQLVNEAGPQSVAEPIAKSGWMQELKKYAPIAGDITASSLIATPNAYAKAAGGLLAAGIGAYEATPGKRIQGAIENVGIDSLPGAAGRIFKSVAGKGVAKNTIKATEKLFEARVKPFEEIVSEANKLGNMKTPQNLSAVKNKLSTELSGHQKNWTKQLYELTKFGNKPSFGNAQKAQSALGQIERADVDESVRATARDMRKRILGEMQTHLTNSGDPTLLPKYANTMRNYAESGSLLKDLVKKSKDMSAKDFTNYIRSLTKKGGLPEDLSSLTKSIRKRESVGKFAKGAASLVAPGIPAGAIVGYDKIMNILKGI